MIPKIIHYCWLSGDPIPDDMQQMDGIMEEIRWLRVYAMEFRPF